MKSHGVLLCLMVSYDVSWCLMECLKMPYDVSWCLMMSYVV